MANICNNWVEIQGDEKQVKEFIVLVGESFDFQKIVPTGETKDEAIEAWGCGSIAFDTDFESDGDEANWCFWTKWNPPYKLYSILVKKFPDISIYWRYEEAGNGLYGYLNEEEANIKEVYVCQIFFSDEHEVCISIFAKKEDALTFINSEIDRYCKKYYVDREDIDVGLDQWHFEIGDSEVTFILKEMEIK